MASTDPIVIFKSPEEVSTDKTNFTILKTGSFDDFSLKYNIVKLRIHAEMRVEPKYSAKLLCKLLAFSSWLSGKAPFAQKIGRKAISALPNVEKPIGYCLIKVGGCGVAGFATESAHFEDFGGKSKGNRYVCGDYVYMRPPIARTSEHDPVETRELQIVVYGATSDSKCKVHARNVKIELMPLYFQPMNFKIVKLYAQELSTPITLELFGGQWYSLHNVLLPVPLRPCDEGKDSTLAILPTTSSPTLAIKKEFFLAHTAPSVWENFKLMLRVGFFSKRDGDITYLDRVEMAIHRVNVVGYGKPKVHYARLYRGVGYDVNEKNNSTTEITKCYILGAPACYDTFQRGELLKLIVRIYGHVKGEKGCFRLYHRRGVDDLTLISQVWGF